MLGLSTIVALNEEAGRIAAQEGLHPYCVCAAEKSRWVAQVEAGQLPRLPFPNFGTYEPEGWEEVNRYFVDKTGWGTENEPALTVPAFIHKIKVGKGYAIVEEGEFQVYIGEFAKV